MKHEIYYVTTNPGKVAEVAEYAQLYAPEIEIKQFSADIDEIQSNDQVAIARDKAKKAWDLLRKPVLVDDSGIFFEKYYKFPGTISKFVSYGLGFDGIKRLIDEGDRAYFLLSMVYIETEDQLHMFEGRTNGRLTKPEKFEGDPHLPYDVYFIPDGSDVTNAVMRQNFKDTAQFYYRIKALQQFLTWFKARAK